MDTHLLTSLNHMLNKQHNSRLSSGVPVCSSELDRNQLHNAIIQSYFELDKDLRKVVKDDSGSVCVGIKKFQFSQKNKNIQYI